MDLGMWAVAVLVLLAPLVLGLFVVLRSELKTALSTLFGLASSGAIAYMLVFALREGVEYAAGLDMSAGGAGGGTAGLLYILLVVAPVQLALCVAAMIPWWRLFRARAQRGFTQKQETFYAICFAVSVALGFATARSLAVLLARGDGWIDVARAAVAVPTFASLCGLWGFALGQDARRGLRSSSFRGTWFLSVLLAAATEHMIYVRGALALLGTLPLLVCMALPAWILWRDVVRRDEQPRSTRFSALSIAPSASFNSLQEAFRTRQSQVTARWVSAGVLVTTGMITVGLLTAVLVGHKVGADFAVVDRPDAGASALFPLALLATGGLSAFPGAGYLLARASGTSSVLEPALSSALTILLVMVVMGMAEPTSIVFAIAFAPVAFGLGCIGAWMGLSG